MYARSKRRGGVWLSSFSVTHWPAGWVRTHATCARCTGRPVAVGVGHTARRVRLPCRLASRSSPSNLNSETEENTGLSHCPELFGEYL